MGLSITRKFAILSHILPPSPSGQAMVLSGLLKTLPHEEYCLISCHNYDGSNDGSTGSFRLGGAYYHLKPTFQLSRPNRFGLSIPRHYLNSTLGIISRARQIARILQATKSSLLIACTGDLYDLPAGYLACKWTGIRFMVYLFDDYIFQWTGVHRSIAKLLEPVLVKNAAGLIAPNEYVQDEYQKRYGVKSFLLRNPSIMPDLDEIDRTEPAFNSDEINIVYTGAVYHAHFDAFRNLVAAIRLLDRNDIKLHIFSAQPEKILKEQGISGPMVKYHDHIAHSEVPKTLRNSSILFLPLAFNSPIPEVIRTSAPGKMGEYLAAGRPILVHAPGDTFVTWYFNRHKCGLVVDKLDPGLMAKALDRLINEHCLQANLSQNARIKAEQDFNLETIRLSFISQIDHVIQGETV